MATDFKPIQYLACRFLLAISISIILELGADTATITIRLTWIAYLKSVTSNKPLNLCYNIVYNIVHTRKLLLWRIFVEMQEVEI